jgi:hypothetical protein
MMPPVRLNDYALQVQGLIVVGTLCPPLQFPSEEGCPKGGVVRRCHEVREGLPKWHGCGRMGNRAMNRAHN